MPDVSIAPWTAEQVRSLNDYQASGVMHPFTCDGDYTCGEVLIATLDGWVCPGCAYTQNWAAAWMADGSWRDTFRKHPLNATMSEPHVRQRAIAWRRPTHDENDGRLTAPYSWYGWLSIYAKRWTWTPPWGSTWWALPAVRYFRGGDEYCNDTLLIQVPFLGHVTFWKPWGELRTTRCDQCVADGFGDDDD